MQKTPSLKSKSFFISFTFAICLGSFASSYISTCLTQIAPLLREKNELSFSELVWQLSIASSSYNFGSIIGPILYRRMTHFTCNYSMTKILIFLDGICLMCSFLLLLDLHFYNILAARLILGVFMGITTSLVPAIIRLLSPLEIAGKMGTINQLMQTTGVFFGSLLGFLCMNLPPADEIYWRLFLAFPFMFLACRIISLMYLFPADYYDSEQLKLFVNKLYSNQEEALPRIKEIIEVQHNQSKGQIKEKNSPSYNRRLSLGILLMFSNQVTGINAIILYLKQLVSQLIEPKEENKIYAQIFMCSLTFTQIIATFLATTSIEKFGRREVIVSGQAKIIIILVTIFFVEKFLGFIGSFYQNLIIMILIFGHIIVHNKSLGAMGIVYCADILDDLSWMTVSIKICSFTVAMTSEFMIEYLGISNMFLIFALLSGFAHVFVSKWMIETKNLCKDEIYALFDGQTIEEKRQKLEKVE